VTNQAALVRWRMGLITDESPAARVRQHAKLLSELEARASHSLGREVRVDLKLYKFHEDFVADLNAGSIDFGRLGALLFLRARRSQPALIPLVIPTTFSKVGLLFTRTNTGIRSMPEVRGHSVAFGDTNSTISFWAQIKLAEEGITATNLARHDFVDSTLDFADEVLEVGYSNAVSRIGYLHSHAQVIEGVLSGRYDVGVAMLKAFDIHKGRGLVAIPGTEFQSSRNIWIAHPRLDPSSVQAIIRAMTSLQGHWLEALPDKSPGYGAAPSNAFDVEQQWLDRIESFFPLKPSPPRNPVANPTK
jgi:ABC-type phosphate/phosphonate transport system substrate-binding protein